MDVRTDLLDWEVVERDPFGRLAGLTARIGSELSAPASYRMLVPVDGSPASLAALAAAAATVGRSGQSDLRVLNVQTVLGNTADDETLMHAGLADTESARRILDDAGVPYQLRLAAGNPADTIVADARKQGMAEIVMGADGAGSVACALLGSVALEVLERTDIAVTLVKSQQRIGKILALANDILLACDGSAGSLRALQHALAYSRAQPSQPRLHVLNVRAYDAPRRVQTTRRDVDFLRGNQFRALQDCDIALRTLESAGADFEFHVAYGDPVEKILELAKNIPCRRIVMASRGLGWFGGLLAGSISWGVLYRTAIPLTLVK
jgi:nucleotide-binding universal stress UspA family protein